jgi:hypothetical protein
MAALALVAVLVLREAPMKAAAAPADGAGAGGVPERPALVAAGEAR